MTPDKPKKPPTLRGRINTLSGSVSWWWRNRETPRSDYDKDTAQFTAYQLNNKDRDKEAFLCALGLKRRIKELEDYEKAIKHRKI